MTALATTTITIRHRLCAVAALAAAVLAPSAARADVPFHKVYLTNAVQVEGQEAFPDWVVLVFPGGPPSGRPVAWPSLVEPGFQTVIDRKTLGTPALWILPRAALVELAAAATENDDQLDGPVASLLKAKGARCGDVDIEDSATLPFTAPEQRLVTYRLEEAAPGRCVMKMLRADYTGEDFKRPPSWARFAPKKRKADAGAPSAAASVSASPPAPAAPSASASAAPSAPAAPAVSCSVGEPPVPERAKGCACSAVGERDGGGGGGGGGAAPGALTLAALGIVSARRRAPRVKR